MKYEKAILGGTFDHFHRGHQAILNRAFTTAKYIYIGIAGDEFVGQVKSLAEKFPLSLQKFESRQNSVIDFLQTHDFLQRATIVKIEDKYDISISETTYEAIVVSPETEPVGREINLIRLKNGLPELQIELVPWVMAADAKPINSFRIRGGEIDRDGKLFDIKNDWGVRFLPEKLRKKLKKPMGEFFPDETAPPAGGHEQGVAEFAKKYLGAGFCIIGAQEFRPKIIAVGDAVNNALLNQNIQPDISIIDLKIKRIPVYKNAADLGFRDIKVHKYAKNAAGTVNIEAFQMLNSLIRSEAKPTILQIEGEDDLLALVACYLSPLNYLIVYGQPASIDASQGGPGEGVVAIEVDEEIKQRAREMLSQFEKE